MILISNRQEKVEVVDGFNNIIMNVIEHTLKEEQVSIECEVSVIFIDNEEIKEINKEHRNIDKVTDVLSFPMLDYPKGKVFKEVYLNYEFSQAELFEGKLILGDIALSLERAQEQSSEYGHSFLREAAYLTVHSVLHLLGYDHMVEEDKERMRKREEEILNSFNLTR